MWIEKEDLELLNSVFEPLNLVPKNNKKELKLRHISFFYTDTKSIINVCKNMERLSMQENLQNQYIRVLRKMGLVNKSEKITKYGEMLLKIIHHNNNRIIDEMTKPNVGVENISEDIPFIVEFFLSSVVKRCLEDRKDCEKNDVTYEDLASEPFDSLHYFFNNIMDTLKEPTNKNKNLNDFFGFENSDFYYTIQGMNFSGYEVKRLFRLEPDKITKVLNKYLCILDEVDKNEKAIKKGKTDVKIDVTSLSPNEMMYYHYARYYTNMVQKDVRNRIKHAVLNYIILDSIENHRNHTRMIKKKEYDAILPYSFIEEVYEKYKLKDVYNLVFFERDSQYITNQIKPLKVTDAIVNDVETNRTFIIEEMNLRQQHVNIGDDIMFSDDRFTRIMKNYVYRITSMKKNGTSITVNVTQQEEMNSEMEQIILNKFKED